MQETREMQVQSLGRDDPQGEKMAAHPRILAWKIPWTEELGYTPKGHEESNKTEGLSTHALDPSKVVTLSLYCRHMGILVIHLSMHVPMLLHPFSPLLRNLFFFKNFIGM